MGISDHSRKDLAGRAALVDLFWLRVESRGTRSGGCRVFVLFVAVAGSVDKVSAVWLLFIRNMRSLSNRECYRSAGEQNAKSDRGSKRRHHTKSNQGQPGMRLFFHSHPQNPSVSLSISRADQIPTWPTQLIALLALKRRL